MLMMLADAMLPKAFEHGFAPIAGLFTEEKDNGRSN